MLKINFSRKVKMIFVLGILFLSFLVSQELNAGIEHNVSGFAWSSNIGWISFNSLNCDTDRNGFIDSGACGGDNETTVVKDYGVNIDGSTGLFSGYAWSSNIGWINFAPEGPYPDSPNYSACLDFAGSGQICDGLGSNKAGGWARACSVFQSGCSGALNPNRGGWDGWIKLRGSKYGIDFTLSNGELSGFAWSDDKIGWISFGGALYQVVTTAKLPPKVSTGAPEFSDGEQWIYCTDSLHPILHWTYEDGIQFSYQIQINKGSADFHSPTYDTGEIISSSNSYATTQSFEWDKKYYWQVRAKNQEGTWSNWSNTDSFNVPEHAYPMPDFIYNPLEIKVNENVDFTDASVAYGGATITAWSWVFQDGNPASSNLQNPQDIKFLSAGSKTVSLEAADSDGYSCPTSKNISVSFPLPEWKEVLPR